MSFTDYMFFPLLFVMFVLYFVTPMKKRWITLLVLSILFFCTWGIELLPFALGAVLVCWGITQWMDAKYEKMDAYLAQAEDLDSKQKQAVRLKTKNQCKYILWLGVAMVLGVLVYTKSQRSLAELPGISWLVWFFSKVYQHIGRLFLRIPGLSFLVQDVEGVVQTSGFSFFVPLGISYYTMSLVGYAADVYWRKEKAEKNFLSFCSLPCISRSFWKARFQSTKRLQSSFRRDTLLNTSVFASVCRECCGAISKSW